MSAGVKGSSQISVQMLAFPSSSLSLLAVCQSLYASIFTRSGSHLYNPIPRQAARRGLLGGHRLGAAAPSVLDPWPGEKTNQSTRPPNPSTTPSSFYAKPPLHTTHTLCHDDTLHSKLSCQNSPTLLQDMQARTSWSRQWTQYVGKYALHSPGPQGLLRRVCVG